MRSVFSKPVGGLFEPRIVVDAGVDAYLSLRGVDRYNSFTGSMTTASDSLIRSTGSWSADGFVLGDLVVVFGQDTPLELIRRVRPSALVKGGDYRPDQVVGRDLVERQGGQVVLIDLVPGFSTTRIVQRSRRRKPRRR